MTSLFLDRWNPHPIRNPCSTCRVELWIEYRPEPRRMVTWPWFVCHACGYEYKGEPAEALHEPVFSVDDTDSMSVHCRCSWSGTGPAFPDCAELYAEHLREARPSPHANRR